MKVNSIEIFEMLYLQYVLGSNLAYLLWKATWKYNWNYCIYVVLPLLIELNNIRIVGNLIFIGIPHILLEVHFETFLK